MIGDIVRTLLNPFVHIKKEELPKALLMFLYFFLTITAYYILKPVRDSIFLDKYGAENLPIVWLLTIVIMSIVVSIYVKFVDYLQKNVLLSSTVIFFVSNLVVFWWLAKTESAWVTGVFFVWVSIFSVMTVTQFWLYANDLFNPREAKRLFGFVGSGGILGGITGGIITKNLAMVVGTRNMLLVAAFILLLCALVINVIWEFERKRGFLRHESAGQIKSERKLKTWKVVSMIWKKKYLFLIVGLVCVAKIVSTLVDYQFKNIVQDFVIGRDEKTAFFGSFFAWLNAISFTVQFFFTSFILRAFGVGAALFLLPVGLAFGSVAILTQPALWSAAFTMIYDGSINYSLNNSTKEVLYLPIVRELRYKVKPFIDMVGYRMAKAIGSILILGCVNLFHLDERNLSAVSLALIAGWIIMIVLMRKEYVNALREFLAGDVSPAHDTVSLESEAWLLGSFLRNASPSGEKDKIIAARLLNLSADAAFIAEAKKKLSQGHKSGEALEHWFADGKLEDELRKFLSKWSLDEAGAEIRFMTDFRRDRPETYRAYFEHRSPFVKVASLVAEWYLEKKELAPDLAAALEQAAPFAMSHGVRGKSRSAAADTLTQVVEALERTEAGPADVKDVFEKFPKKNELLSLFTVMIGDKDLPAAIRRRLPLLIVSAGGQDAVILLYRLLSDEDSYVRDQAVHALVSLRAKSPQHFFQELAVKAEIEHEASVARDVQRMIEFYKFHRANPPADDPFLKAQEARFHESVHRIFLLLGLLAEPEDIRTIYRSLKNPNDHVKANALELLEHVLEDQHLKKAIFPLIEAEFASGQDWGRVFRYLTSGSAENAVEYEAAFKTELTHEIDSWHFLSMSVLALLFHKAEVVNLSRFAASSSRPLMREIGDILAIN